MQNILLIAVIIECAILFILAGLKKLTKNTFFVITVATVLFCGVGLIFLNYGNRESKIKDQRGYIYMAARLAEDNYRKEALEPLGQIGDSESGDYAVQTLRGLIYNLNESYQTSVYCVAGSEDEKDILIYHQSIEEKAVDKDNVSVICNSILDDLSASKEEKERWEAQMKLQYLGLNVLSEAENDVVIDAFGIAKEKIRNDDYQGAFEIIKDEAENNNIQADVLISEMYVQNYNLRTMADGDLEYQTLWEEITKQEVKINQLNVEFVSAEDESDEVSDAIREEYDNAYAQYCNLYDKLSRASIKRAINYLENVKYDTESIGYLFQLSYLYYRDNNEEKSQELLKEIFEVSQSEKNQWLGNDLYLLKRSFCAYLSGESKAEYDTNFYNMMNHIYQNVFDVYDSRYEKFVTDYLQKIYGDFFVLSVDTKDYPEITANVALNSNDFELNTDSISINDTGNTVEDFSIVESENTDLNICFVVDRSGSMEGEYIKNCKSAICDSISSLDETTKIGLVSFESTARIDSTLTTSQFQVKSEVEGLVASGGTNIASGLDLAREVLLNASGKKVVILLSDGFDADDGERRLDDVLDELVGQNIMVYSIGLQGCDEEYLQKISERTGGTFRLVQDSNDLIEVYRGIQNAILNTYQIIYCVTDDAEYRELEIYAKDSLAQAFKLYSSMPSEQETSDVNYLDMQQRSDFFKQIGGE